MLAGGRMNLAEYAQMDMRWFWELRLALSQYRDGQRQSSDIQRMMAEERARHEGIAIAG